MKVWNVLFLASLTLVLAVSAQSGNAASFATPEAAVEALAEAVATRDRSRFRELFGPGYWEFASGQMEDPDLARARLERFDRALHEFHSLAPRGKDRYTLYVGANGWPFAIPIVRSSDGWRFDGDAGVEELRDRLVGANELNAISVLDAYVQAQRNYALKDQDGDGVLEYAQHLMSDPGSRNGLIWLDEEGVAGGPLGWLQELADVILPDRPAAAPLLGYYYGLLKAQGPNGNAGAYDYRINGHMVAGFAAVAWPAEYGHTGVKTFIVSQDGVVYERDLGPDSGKYGAAMTEFNPDESWSPVSDNIVALTPPHPD